MAKQKTNAAAPAVATELSELAMHEKMNVNGWEVTRVPGGFIYARGAATQFVPLNELSAGECNMKIEEAQ